MNIFCLGISHRTANVEIRERFAIPDTALVDSLNRLAQMSSVNEGVLLSTCNRTEFYLVSQNAQLDIQPFVQDFYGTQGVADLEHLFRLSAIPTVRHLFRVASGLESMVIGETEIFGQVKRAYEIAAKFGTTGKILNRLFQKAFHVGKHVRSTTAITRGGPGKSLFPIVLIVARWPWRRPWRAAPCASMIGRGNFETSISWSLPP